MPLPAMPTPLERRLLRRGLGLPGGVGRTPDRRSANALGLGRGQHARHSHLLPIQTRLARAGLLQSGGISTDSLLAQRHRSIRRLLRSRPLVGWPGSRAEPNSSCAPSATRVARFVVLPRLAFVGRVAHASCPCPDTALASRPCQPTDLRGVQRLVRNRAGRGNLPGKVAGTLPRWYYRRVILRCRPAGTFPCL